MAEGCSPGAIAVNANVGLGNEPGWRRLRALAQAGLDPQVELLGLTQRVPRGIERTKLFFRFREHSEISITLDRLKMSQVLRVLRSDRLDDNSSHKFL